MRPIDADALIATMENMRSISNNVKQRQIEESILHGIVPQIIDDAPTIEAEPCTLCVYNPPSSCDGKPCTACPAHKRSTEPPKGE